MAAVEASAPQPALLTWKTAMSRAVVTPDSPPNEHLSESYTTETIILEGMHQHLRRLHEVKNCCKTNEHAILSAKPGQLSRQDTYNRTQSDRGSRRFENQEDAHTVYKLRKSFQTLVRHALLRRREEEFLTAEELATVGQTLQSVCSARTQKTVTGYGGCLPYLTSGRCNYTDFSHLRDNIPERARYLFGVQHFLQCTRDQHGRINTAEFFRHTYNLMCLLKTKITLLFYNESDRGSLGESDLEGYVYDLVLSLPALQHLPDNFASFYVFTAVRRFMFFLDVKRTGRVDVRHLISSQVMEELMALAMMNSPPPPPPQSPFPAAHGARAASEEASFAAECSRWQERASKNWFSTENALRVYNMYLELDRDQNGLLNKIELLRYPGFSQATRLTSAFVDRVFEESITYRLPSETAEEDESLPEAEMDYKVFLDFVLAMENRSSPPALKWLFRILDVQKTGFLSPFAIRSFFREVANALERAGMEAPLVDDVIDEVFDMVRPQDPSRGISQEDLLTCGVGSIVVSMLIDVQSFLSYDQREHSAAAAAAAAAAALEEGAEEVGLDAERETLAGSDNVDRDANGICDQMLERRLPYVGEEEGKGHVADGDVDREDKEYEISHEEELSKPEDKASIIVVYNAV